ncbi:uncharacterized protein [Miscanthus floridulus]|uniref:uncharacterized protein n=1 Tax=Miscanthus floridulus TaxID=154761 RepID=UPI0034593487
MGIVTFLKSWRGAQGELNPSMLARPKLRQSSHHLPCSLETPAISGGGKRSGRRPAVSWRERCPWPRRWHSQLQVGRAATQVEIKAAYRAMAKHLHPDTSRSSSSRTAAAFLEIQRAYETLSDPDARAQYDRSLGPPHRPRPGAGVMQA